MAPENQSNMIPLGDKLVFRIKEEKSNEEVYSSIPSLNDIANSVMRIANKLSHGARHALFFQDSSVDPTLRALAVEIGMRKRQEMETAAPDVQYLGGQQRPSDEERVNIEKERDIWMPALGKS